MLKNANSEAIVWAAALEFPQSGRPTVYLDLNHWIGLAKAAVGHEQGKDYVEVLETCRSAVRSGAATFVLAASHYTELLKIESPRQRRDVADVMEALSQFNTILSRVEVMRLEFAAALDHKLQLENHDPAVLIFGYGVIHAFGRGGKGRFRVRDRSTGADVTEGFRERFGPDKFDALMAKGELGLEQGVLRGPANAEELQKLVGNGYAPQKALKVADVRAKEERAQSLRLDGGGSWRRGRLLDVVTVRELLIEFQNIAPAALQARGLTFQDVVTSPEAGVAFMRSMPTTRVGITLKTAWHRNRDKPWSANDIHDIDAMALAVPYCDVVVTEKACHHALVAARLDEVMDTTILRDLKKLPAVLIEWPSIEARKS